MRRYTNSFHVGYGFNIYDTQFDIYDTRFENAND